MWVLYFAQAADAAGCREESWEQCYPLTLEEFWREALRRHPGLAGLAPRCRVASGCTYVAADGMLDPREETAVLPPVSGG